MSKVICFLNQKAGSGKTTTVLQTAAGLTKRGKKVLMVDMDPQAKLSNFLGVINTADSITLYELLKGEATFDATIVRTASGDLLPSDLNMGAHEMQLNGFPGRENLLLNAISAYERRYDYVLIDCPSAVNVFFYNALIAATHAVIVMQAEQSAEVTLKNLLAITVEAEKTFRKKIDICGVLWTIVDERLYISNQLTTKLAETMLEYKTQIFKTKIMNSPVVTEALACQRSLFDYAPKSEVTQAYDSAITEVFKCIDGGKERKNKK